MMLASYEYPPAGVPFLMAAALVGLAAFWVWQTSPPGAEWWRHPLVTASVVFGSLTVLFMTWAAATG